MFSYRMVIRFGDTDPAGIVYYPHIFHYLHIAMEEFFRARCGVAYHELVKSRRIGFPTVNVAGEFRQPLEYGNEIEISIKIERVGNSSLSLNYQIRRVTDNDLCAEFSQVHVAMNLDTHQSVPISDDLRHRLIEK